MNNVTIADNHAGSSGAASPRAARSVSGRLVLSAGVVQQHAHCRQRGSLCPRLRRHRDLRGIQPDRRHGRMLRRQVMPRGTKLDATAALAPLQANGGVVETHALLPGSAALDAGNPIGTGSAANACELTDASRHGATERGALRHWRVRGDPMSDHAAARLPDTSGAARKASSGGATASARRRTGSSGNGSKEPRRSSPPSVIRRRRRAISFVCTTARGAPYSREISAAGTCDGRPCWQATAKGFRYRSAALGLQLELNAGLAGAAKVVARVKGLALATPEGDSVPLPVIVRLWNGEGECWEATYSTPSRNMPGLLSARAD